MDDKTFWCESFRDKVGSRSNFWVAAMSPKYSAVDLLAVSYEGPSNFVQFKPEDWSSWYEPTAIKLAYKLCKCLVNIML